MAYLYRVSGVIEYDRPCPCKGECEFGCPCRCGVSDDGFDVEEHECTSVCNGYKAIQRTVLSDTWIDAAADDDNCLALSTAVIEGLQVRYPAAAWEEDTDPEIEYLGEESAEHALRRLKAPMLPGFAVAS